VGWWGRREWNGIKGRGEGGGGCVVCVVRVLAAWTNGRRPPYILNKTMTTGAGAPAVRRRRAHRPGPLPAPPCPRHQQQHQPEARPSLQQLLLLLLLLLLLFVLLRRGRLLPPPVPGGGRAHHGVGRVAARAGGAGGAGARQRMPQVMKARRCLPSSLKYPIETGYRHTSS
jgi:hypothetical protein